MKLSLELENYIKNCIGAEDPVLEELDRETNLKLLHPRMLSGHIQGKLLQMFSQMISPTNILELGTFSGYSAICLAKGLKKGGKLISIELNDELKSFAKKYIKKSGLENVIELKTGSALEIIPTLKYNFDLVFIDADKKEYLEYYKLVFDKVNPGGYIIADNTLWDGKVVEAVAPKDYQTKGVLEFNEFVANDNQVEKVIVPVRDGLTIIRKK